MNCNSREHMDTITDVAPLSIQVKLKCVQTLRTIFLHPERSISTPYIHALAPRIVEYLYSDKSKEVASDLELSFTLECVATIEALIALAEPTNRE